MDSQSEKHKNSPPFSSLPRSFLKKNVTLSESNTTEPAPKKKTAFEVPKGKNDSINFSKDRVKSGSFNLTAGTANRNRASTSLGIKTIKNLGFKTSKTTTLNFYDNWKIGNYPDTCAQILSNLLPGFGISEDDDLFSEILEKVHTRLSEKVANRAPLLKRNQLLQLQQIPEELHEFFVAQRKLEAIVKVQSRIRGYLVRKHVKAFLAKEEGVPFAQTKMYQLLSCFKDLLNTENDYIKKLETIVTWYLLPLRRASNKRSSVLSNFLQGITISSGDVSAIFSNIETLYNVHLNIQKNFESVAADWPFINNVGYTFIKMAPDLVAYGDYVRNCKNALDTLVRCKEEDPKLAEYLQETMLQGHGDLMGMLVRPLNHISNYKEVLKFFINNSPPNHPDMENLRNAYVAIKKTCKFIQESNKQAAERAKLGEVSRRLQFKNPTELSAPKRLFEEEGEIVTVEKTIAFNMEKDRHYFLFTDLFIIGEESGKACKVRNMFNLKDSQVEDSTTPTSFSICEGTEKANIICKNPQQKLSLMKKLSEHIENLSITNKMFGVPLQKLIEREQTTIPYIVRTAVEYLRTKRETEGIFRISGGTAEVAALKSKFNNVQDLNQSLDLSAYSAHTVAANLKAWFRELPEPIMTFQSYEPLSALPLGGDEQKNEALQTIRQVIAVMPTANQQVLKFLVEFLVSVAQEGHINKMTFANLAIVFGPNLLYAQEESLESILRIPKINAIVQLILENHADLF